MWSGRLTLFIFILFISSSNWVLEEFLMPQRTDFARLDSLSFTLLLISLLYFLFNLLGRLSFISLLLVYIAINFTFVSHEFYQYFGSYISYEQVFMFKDLISAAKHLPLPPIIVMVSIFLLTLWLGLLVFSKSAIKSKNLSIWQRWRAPCFYFIGAILVFQAHEQRYNHRDIGISNINDSELTYDFSMESPLMFFIRSLPTIKQFYNTNAYIEIENLKILAKALKNNSFFQLPDKYHFSKFNDLLLDYPGYQQVKNEFEPLLFQPANDDKNKHKYERKNIILIVLESLRSYETGLYNPVNSITPNLDGIASQAIVVSNFYSNSRTTVQAEQSILCSTLDFASKSPYSIKKGRFNGKCLPKLLSNEGYETYWYHGYTKTFFNREQFHPSLGFNNLFAKEEFIQNGYDEKLDIGWGVPDPITFDKIFHDMNEHNKVSEKPFFTQILTLTNHQPFKWNYTGVNFPKKINKKSNDIYPNYQKGIFYTDDALGKFWDKFNNSTLAKNTIVIITADHGVPFYPNDVTDNVAKHEILYRVPLLIVTPERTHRIIDEPLSHLDIAPTALSMLNITAPVSFIGRPFLGKYATLAARPLFQMNTSYYGFQYNGMKCLPYKEVCQTNTGQCRKISDSFCSSENEKNFTLFEQSKHFMNYLELAVEAGYPSSTRGKVNIIQ